LNRVPPTRSQLLPRRIVALGAAIGVLGGLGAYVPVTLLAPVAAATASVDAFEAPANPVPDLVWPALGASAVGAVGFDGILSSSGSADALPIASISKVITALVVLEAKPLGVGESGPPITFTAADVALHDEYQSVDGKVEPVQAGVVMTERQVLEVMLVSSANNYTQSLVNWAFGSNDGFVSAASDWLASNAFAATTLVEPTGISPRNVSSASDLIGIGKIAIADPVLAEIVATDSAEIPFVGRIDNTNDLLGIDGVDGIKTGTLDEAGACLLFAADYAVGSQLVTVVGVVLGGVDHDSLDAAISPLLVSVATGFREVTLAEQGEAFARYDTPWKQSADAVARDAASVVVWSDTPITAETVVDRVRAASAGDTVGSVTFTAGNRIIEIPLMLDDEISDPSPWWRLSHPAEFVAPVVFGRSVADPHEFPSVSS
jgi:D-alanyl-D-alanine carboxypeptidase (penicillin-binding protein 5/6)